MKTSRIRAALLFMVSTALVLSGCGLPSGTGTVDKNSKMKVALVLVGPISDAGWNASAYDGLMKMQQEKGLEVAFSESVPFAESQATIRDYASRGYQLVIANNFVYGDAMEAVAKDFPDTKFAVLTGRVKGPNLSSYDPGQREGTFLGGALAALMSKTGVIGIVGGHDEPAIIRSVEGFKAGARYVKPEIRVKSSYTGSFADVAKAKEVALAQITAGADVVGHVANESGLGVIQAAKEKGVFAIGTGTDQHAVAPKTVLATAMTDMTVLIRMVVEDAQSGNYGNQIVMAGLKEGAASLSPFYELDDAVPAAVKQRLADLAEEINSGKLVVPETSTKTD